MKYFESEQGFDRIINLVKTARSIELVFVCLGIVSAPHMLYHRLYVNTKIAEFVEAFMEYMSRIPEDQARFIKSQILHDALIQIENLMRRVYTAKTKNELLIKLRVDISISLLSVDQLEKRIQAIKIIAESCKAAKESREACQPTHLPTANDSIVLSKILKFPRIIDEIFGKRSHIELIQRFTEILKFIVQNSKITKRDFNIIWECCTQDEQSKVEVFKVLSDSADLLPGELIAFIVEKYVAIPRAFLKDQDIILLCKLLSVSSKATSEALSFILDLLWEVIRGMEENLSEEANKSAVYRFCDVITTPNRVSREVMKEYFDQCYKMLEEGNNSTLALKILRKSMAQLHNPGDNISINELLLNFLNEGNAINNFFKDFEKYYIAKKTNTANGILNLKKHEKEIQERKSFLLFLLKTVKYKLTKQNLELLWGILITDPIVAEDQVAFYDFFNELISSGIEESVVSMADVCDFFSITVCKEDNNFQKLSIEVMKVIEALLITVNRVKGKIMEIGTIKRRRNGFSNNRMIGPMAPGYVNEDKEGIIEFRVKVLPSEIIGTPIVWKIILEAENENVAVYAIELINKIYTKLSEEMEDKIAEISSSFIDTAIKQLKLYYKRMVQEKLSRSSEIVKVLRLIEQMLDDSEKRGNAGITPFASLFKGQDMKLTIQNFAYDPLDRTDGPDKIELIVHSKVTYWQLLMLVARRLNMNPELLTLKFSNTEIFNKDNAKTLEELKVTENIKVTRRTEDSISRLNLTKGDRLTKRAKAVFVEIYKRFSKEGKMDKGDYVEFARACLCDRSITSSDSQIIKVFNDYDKDNKGYLKEEEFLEFYEVSSVNKEEVVWNNLRGLRYGPDLKRIDESKKDALSTAIVFDRLPRYLLSNDSDYLSFIFSLVSKNSLSQYRFRR